ncbi:MAG: hypothetical protein KJ879_03475 [Nanoarchaeota archaeon]|nr:hypothetical protein [Nanoarchaeota archaeon]
MPKHDSGKKFVWMSLRISFWIMIFFWILSVLLDLSFQNTGEIIFVIFWMGSIIFTFVSSILHLTKHKKKSFAVVALVFSSLLLLLFLFGFFWGLLGSSQTHQIIFDEEDEFIAADYYDSFSFEVYDYSYLSMDFSSSSPVNLYLLEENEYLRYDVGEGIYYVKASENSKFYSLQNIPLSPDTYYIVIETIDSSTTYDILVESDSYS